MLKVIILLKKYIIAYMFLDLLFFAGVYYFTSLEYWEKPILNLFSFNGAFNLMIFYFLYVYIKKSLVVEFNNIKVTFIDDIVCVFATIFFVFLIAFIVVYKNVSGEYISLLKILLFLVFISAPIYWIKFIINLNLWFWSKVLSIFITVKTSYNLIEKEKSGNISVFEAMNTILSTNMAINELNTILNIEFEPNSKNNYYELLKDFSAFKELNYKWRKRRNLLIVSLVLILVIGNITNGFL